MTDFPEQADAALRAFYGNPDANGDGQADPLWEAENITRFAPPYPMKWSWCETPVRVIAMHRRCAEAFKAALAEIGEAFTAEERKRYQLDRCGGGYNFRTMRGSSKLSVHSYGAALDLAPDLNPLGRAYKTGDMMPKKAVEIFAKHGIIWGGLWRRPDAMHFQATK